MSTLWAYLGCSMGLCQGFVRQKIVVKTTHIRTSVVSDAKSVVTPTCSLVGIRHSSQAVEKLHSLGNRQQVIPIHTLVLVNLVIITYPACVDHDAPLWVGLWIQQVVALGAEMQRSLQHSVTSQKELGAKTEHQLERMTISVTNKMHRDT
jgi:hypothetical protein